MENWRNWNIGDKIRWSWEEFDGKGSTVGVLTSKEEDHAIVEADGMDLWVDDIMQDMFCKV